MASQVSEKLLKYIFSCSYDFRFWSYFNFAFVNKFCRTAKPDIFKMLYHLFYYIPHLDFRRVVFTSTRLKPLSLCAFIKC